MANEPKKFNYSGIAFSNEMLTPDAEIGVSAGAKVGRVAHVFIWGAIGGWWGVYGQDVFRLLAGENPNEIRVYISSGGGGVVEAFEIYNLLRGTKARVVTYNFSLAASAATIVSAAGDDGFRIAAPSSIYMIHEGRPGMYGYYSEDELSSKLSQTRAFNDRISAVYASLTGRSMEEEKAEMKREIWHTAETARAAGYIDRVELMEIPFHLAKITEEEFYSDYAEHTAQYARAEFTGAGFVASINVSNQNRFTMNLQNKIANFFAALGLKFRNDKDEELTAEAVAAMVTEEKETELKGLLAPDVKNEVSAALKAAFSEQVEAMKAELRADQKAAYDAEKAKWESDLKAMRAELANLKAPKPSGGQPSADAGTGTRGDAAEDKSFEEEVNERMGNPAAILNLVNSGLISEADIRKLAEDAVTESRAAKKN